jgi:hypothetical protein
MSQIYPNFVRPDSALGGPAPIQTMRQTHTLTAGEQSQGYFALDFVLPFAFADTNYTISIAIEQEPGVGQIYTCNVYGKTASDFHVHVSNGFDTAGDVVTVHAVAIHD